LLFDENDVVARRKFRHIRFDIVYTSRVKEVYALKWFAIF